MKYANYWSMLPSNWKGPMEDGRVIMSNKPLYYLDEWKREGVVRIVGWDQIVNKFGKDILSLLEKDYIKEFKAIYGKKKNHLLKNFIYAMSKQDVILLNQGLSQIVAVGKIISGVQWDEGAQHPIYRRVEWHPSDVSIPLHKGSTAFSSPVVHLDPDKYEYLIAEVDNILS